MAMFTGLAIGAALAGGMLAGKKLGNKQQQQVQTPPTAPGPSGTPGGATGDVPAPPIVNPGADMAQAQGAGAKQRKRAAAGGFSTHLLPKPGAVKAKTTPKTLTGY